jgi:hypothetical protein
MIYEPLSPLLRRVWPALPLLLAAAVPWAAGALLSAALALAGAILVLPLAAAASLGPGWQLLSVVGAAVLADEVPAVSSLPRLLAVAARLGLTRALPLYVPAQLAAVNLVILDPGAPRLLYASLAANLVALGCAAFVAPFAYAAGALRPVGNRVAWRVGAAVAAGRPAFVVGGLAVAMVVTTGLRLLGPPLLVVIAGPAAMSLVAVTRQAISSVLRSPAPMAGSAL